MQEAQVEFTVWNDYLNRAEGNAIKYVATICGLFTVASNLFIAFVGVKTFFSTVPGIKMHIGM